jgi:hypothetical protein
MYRTSVHRFIHAVLCQNMTLQVRRQSERPLRVFAVFEWAPRAFVMDTVNVFPTSLVSLTL